MDKSWMNIVHRLSDPRYELGVMKFLDFAYRNKDKRLEIPCPCKICHNFRPQKKDTVYKHLMQKGISLDYIRWTEHGEASDGEDDGEADMLIDESQATTMMFHKCKHMTKKTTKNMTKNTTKNMTNKTTKNVTKKTNKNVTKKTAKKTTKKMTKKRNKKLILYKQR